MSFVPSLVSQTRVRFIAFITISFVYLAQCFTTLRLVNDGVAYLLQASSALDGHGFLVHGAHSMRPAGYPALIFGLSKISLGTSWAIVGLNCIFLGVGIWAAYFVLRHSFEFSSTTAQLISLGTLLSLVMIRNVTYPLSDICFFGASVPCLLVMLRAEGESPIRRFLLLALLAPLIVLCIELRTIGLFLVPAFFWALLGGIEGWRKVYPLIARYRLAVVFVSIIAIAAVVPLLIHSQYFQFNLPMFRHRGIYRSIAFNIEYQTADWGEMALNVPISRIPAAFGIVLRICGGMAVILAGVGFWSRLYHFDSLAVYVLGFSAVIFSYPWQDSRLWLPILPFLMGYTLVGLQRLIPEKVLKPTFSVYGVYFCLLGITALAFSTRLTFAGPRFADIYGDGHFRATYKFALQGEAPTNAGAIDTDGLYLLRRYEWRAKTAGPMLSQH